jgi:hypothetical protein
MEASHTPFTGPPGLFCLVNKSKNARIYSKFHEFKVTFATPLPRAVD